MADFNIMETMLDDGQDNALLRFTMGSAFIKHKKYAQAIEHLARAVELKPDYTSAWLLYGRALVELDQVARAISIIKRGILIANKCNRPEAAEEMQTLLTQLQNP